MLSVSVLLSLRSNLSSFIHEREMRLFRPFHIHRLAFTSNPQHIFCLNRFIANLESEKDDNDNENDEVDATTMTLNMTLRDKDASLSK